MFSPTTTLGFILATLYGATFHLIVGGDARRLAFFLLSGWLGFGIGHFAGVVLQVNILNIGTLHIVTASIGALLVLIFVHVLTSQSKRSRAVR